MELKKTHPGRAKVVLRALTWDVRNLIWRSWFKSDMGGAIWLQLSSNPGAFHNHQSITKCRDAALSFWAEIQLSTSQILRRCSNKKMLQQTNELAFFNCNKKILAHSGQKQYFYIWKAPSMPKTLPKHLIDWNSNPEVVVDFLLLVYLTAHWSIIYT